MTAILVLKASAIWLIMVALAIANGVLRERLLIPNIGYHSALPVSGISLSVMVFLAAYLSIPLFGKNNRAVFICIGLQWVAMTLLFELIFGHYVAGKSWSALFQVFNIMQGDLFIVILLVTLISPYLAAKMRGLT